MSDTEDNLFDDPMDLDGEEENIRINVTAPTKRKLQIQSADSDTEDSDNDLAGEESDKLREERRGKCLNIYLKLILES